MCIYGNKHRIATYVDEALFQKIEAERAITKETQSSMLYSILEAVFNEEEQVEA